MITRLSVALLVWLAFLNAAEAQTIGRTPGQFNVSAVGSAQYSIPIFAPPGPRGMQPNISLFYDSGSSIGPLGIGWSLAGLGQITRCNLTTAQDTTPAPVALVTGDGYCMNGKRLRLTGGTYGAAGSTYQTEIADFSNITAVGTAGNGPQYFTVQGRNGLTYYYGYTDSNGNGANSEVLANGTTTALTWLLSKVVDRSAAANNYVINYTALTGTAVPNDILWTPTSAGASTYQYKMLFIYGANVPASSISAYVAGTPVSNTELLSSIEIFVGTTVVKDYFLGYQLSPLTGREELITVKECADSAGSNCLLPTSINYQTGSPGVSTASNTALSTGGALLTAKYDFNGDGYPDLIYNPTGNGPWYVAFGSASGYGTPINTGITGATLLGNLNGGTQDGILAPNGSTWYYYTWNGSSFTGTSTGLAYDSTQTDYQLADVNGDGRPDLVSYTVTVPRHGSTSLTVYTRLNTTTGSSVTFSSTLNAAYTTTDFAAAQLQTPDHFQFGKLRRYDFNGDGMDDLVMMIVWGTSPSYFVDTYELISTSGGTLFNAVAISSATGASYSPVFFTDWNDDKCTDFVVNNTLYVSGCNGTVPVSYTLSGGVVGALDWDGDKRTDLLVANGSTLGVYLSKATGAPTLTTTSIPYSSSCKYVTMDANGDGLDDLGCWGSSGSLTYYLHNGSSDLATSFADGYGNSASPSYIPLTEGNYTEIYNTPTFPDQRYIGPLYVVSSVIYSDPSAAPGTTFNQAFWYWGGWINVQGRGFEGFGAISTLDSRNGLYDYKYYSTAFPYMGMQFQDIVSNGTFWPSESTGTTALTTLSSTPNQQRYFPYFSNWTSYKWEVGGSENSDLVTTTSTNYTYDNYGNATNIVKTVTDNDPGSPYTGDTWTTNTTNTTDISVNQSADLAQWCLTTLDETQVVYSSTINGSNTVTRTKTFTPDTPTNCRILSAVTEPTANGGLYKVTETLTYDGFGNVHTDTVLGANMPSSPASRLTTLNWGTTGQFLGSVTDPSSATTTASYTSNQSLTFGVPDSVMNPNNLTTSWLYDPFGRKTKETRADGTSTMWTYAPCVGCDPLPRMEVTQQFLDTASHAVTASTLYLDMLDRQIYRWDTSLSGASVWTSVRHFDSLGRVSQEAFPYLTSGSAPGSKTYGYDALNRLTQIQRPISATNSTPQTTTIQYAGRKRTVFDPYGNTKTTITDVNGWLRQTKDAVGYNITRAFDAAGSLTGVTDSVGNTLLSGVTYKYGLKPFRVAATDADRGAWSYAVDSLGERTGWTDAKGQSFTMTGSPQERGHYVR